MSARGGGRPPQSRAVTCIDSPDVAGHRLRAPDWPIHLDQLPASRVLAEAALVKLYGPGASQHQLACTWAALQHMCGVRRTFAPSGAATFMHHGPFLDFAAANSRCPLFCENKPSVLTICAMWG